MERVGCTIHLKRLKVVVSYTNVLSTRLNSILNTLPEFTNNPKFQESKNKKFFHDMNVICCLSLSF